MTKNEIPAALPVQHDEVSFVEASGETDGLVWGIEGIESDHAELSFSGDARSLAELDAMIAALTALRPAMAQAEAIAA